jgi:iron complex outermembrane receptor protein
MRTIARIGALAVLTAGAFTGAIFAQEAEGLDFIVTATRMAEESSSVPAQVTVITAEDIVRSGASTLVQVLDQAPGVAFMPSLAGPGTEAVSMRGFGESSYGRVLVLIDGVRLNNPDMKPLNWNAVALVDIDRIEVLDGSASVLYGNNAVAGVINIITKKGGEGTRTGIAGSAGSFQTNAQKFSHQRSSTMGTLSIATEHLGTVGYRDRQAAQTVNASVRGTMDLSDIVSLSAQASLADLGYQLPGSLTKAQFEADPTQATSWADEGTERQYSGSLGLEWFPGDAFQMEVPISYGYKRIHTDMASWFSYTDRTVLTGEARPKISVEATVAGIPVRLVGGVDLYGARLDVHSFTDVQRTTESNAFTVTELSAGPYLSTRVQLLPYLSASGGMRYDTAVISAVNKDESVKGDIPHSALVYDSSLNFMPLDGLKVFARYGTLFRYPFTDEQASLYGFGSDMLYADLVPETGYNAEGGITLGVGTGISAHANIYYMQMRDEIAYNGSTFRNENLDQTRRFGSSAGLTARPVNYLKLEASYTFANAVFAAGVNEGKRIPLVPVHAASGSMTLTLPAGLSIGPSLMYKSESFQGGDYGNALEKIESYLVYNARVRWDPERMGQGFTVQVTFKNLADTTYAPLVYYGGYYPAEGRSASISVDYRY